MPRPPQNYNAEDLGKYILVEEIAEGTFGKVKKAIHSVTGQRVAMKYISKEMIRQTKTKTRVQREIDYMRMLRHPHIIKLYEVISTPNDIIIVLEYAGGELFQYIVSNGRMSEPQARRIFQQILSGVEYSHRLKIVHRDLKPENVLLDDDLNVKLADYGLSNQMTEGEFLKTSCGSPNYAAPEVIRGGFYSGPEVDVWSAGVILYVMLCGRLPFEDDNVQTLFQMISQGIYHTPAHLSQDAKDLLAGMLAVDPVKRITVPDILQSSFFKKNLPRYLTPLPVNSGPLLGTLSELATAPKQLDFEMIDGLGRMEPSIVEQLAAMLKGVDKEEIWDALRRDDGSQANSVKVAYLLLRDKNRLGKSLADYEEQERDAQLAAMDPSNPLSPLALSPGTEGSEQNVFDIQFADDHEADTSPDTDSLEEDYEEFEIDVNQGNNFKILDTSLPGYSDQDPGATSPHHLYAYANAKSQSRAPGTKEKRPHRTRWHFGIRSRSPPMEVMAEIYRTLKTLGMEWKEKKDLGGLGGSHAQHQHDRARIERAPQLDGGDDTRRRVDLKAAASVYLVESRIRVGKVVVRMNLQLYQVDDINYLVDFHHKRSYIASTESGAAKYDMAHPRPKPIGRVTSHDPSPNKENLDTDVKDHDVVSPFVFMDVACKLIIELAGGE